LEVTLKDSAGVLKVLFGVGFGSRDGLKRFVEDADDPVLFGNWRASYYKTLNVAFRNERLPRAALWKLYESEKVIEKLANVTGPIC